MVVSDSKSLGHNEPRWEGIYEYKLLLSLFFDFELELSYVQDQIKLGDYGDYEYYAYISVCPKNSLKVKWEKISIAWQTQSINSVIVLPDNSAKI